MPKNENKGEEMVAIMETIHRYVPMVEATESVIVPSLNATVEIKKAKSYPVILHGDYVTASRARGAQKAKSNSESAYSRLEGLVPASADWHTKLKLMEVCVLVH